MRVSSGHVPGRKADGKITVPRGSAFQELNYGLYGKTTMSDAEIYRAFLIERATFSKRFGAIHWSLRMVYSSLEQKLGVDCRLIKQTVEKIRRQNKLNKRRRKK